MKVLKSKRNENTVSLELEASALELAAHMPDAFKKVSKNAQLPGFRKGKVPQKLFEKRFGTGVIVEEAINRVMNQVYKQAIDELSLKVIDSPTDVDLDEYVADKPLVFRCNVLVEPEITLKKYKGLAVSVEHKLVTDDMVTEDVNRLLGAQATYETVDRAAKEDDIVRFNATVMVDGEPFALWTRDNQAIRVGSGSYGPDVDAHFMGLKKGDQKTFSVTYAENAHSVELQGKTAEFSISVDDVRGKRLPELTDELAKTLDEGCQSVDDFKARIRQKLTTRTDEANEQAKQKAIEEAVMVANPLDIPQPMIDRRAMGLVAQFEREMHQRQFSLQQYMAITQKTIADIQKDFEPQAKEQVHLQKIFEAIATKEKIVVTDDAIIAEANTLSKRTFETREAVESEYGDAFADIESFVRNKNVMAFLAKSAKIKVV